MKIPNKGLWYQPKFTDAKGVKYEAPSWDLLIKKVEDVRRQNKEPVGDAQKEVYAQFCKKKPEYCVDTDRKRHVENPSEPAHRNILGWVLNRLSEHRAGRLTFVSDRVAYERAAICRACPAKVKWESGCASCTKGIKDALRIMLRGLFRDKQTRDLLGCGPLNEDPRLSTWIEQPKVAPGAVPAGCWRK